jgi:hypothetical protein
MFEFLVKKSSTFSNKMQVLHRERKLVSNEGERSSGLTRSLSGNTLEDIVDERVENSHCFVRDTSIRMDLLKDCQSVRADQK